MFPLSVDGIEIVASLVLLADKRAGTALRTAAVAALVAGTGASFAPNIAVGGSDWIGRAVSGWPPSPCSSPSSSCSACWNTPDARR